MKEGPKQGAQRRAADPVHLVEQGDKEHEPAPVHIFGNLCRAVYGETLIAHAKDQIESEETRTAD